MIRIRVSLVSRAVNAVHTAVHLGAKLSTPRCDHHHTATKGAHLFGCFIPPWIDTHTRFVCRRCPISQPAGCRMGSGPWTSTARSRCRRLRRASGSRRPAGGGRRAARPNTCQLTAAVGILHRGLQLQAMTHLLVDPVVDDVGRPDQQQACRAHIPR